MQLLVGFSGAKASVNYIQLSHRCTAIDYARAGIGRQSKANIKAFFRRDKLFTEFEITMRDWVVETLHQGAYLREYHLWEKDCKAYFTAMASRNRATWSSKPKGGTPFTAYVRETLKTYGVTLPDIIFDPIELMRQRVNVMKHESGLELDHFISEGDYKTATQALERFWELLTKEESYHPNIT